MRTLSAGALALLASLATAVPALSAPSHAETGVIVAQNRDRGPGGQIGEIEAGDARDLGVGWGSIYVSWAALQPDQRTAERTGAPPFDMGQHSVYADRFATMKAAGRKVNVTFIDTPTWASGTSDVSASKNYYPPVNPATFGNFVSAFAKDFGVNIDGYELGNEPDGGHFWLPGPDPAKYAGYAKAGIAAVRANDADAKIFVGATAGANDEFLEPVLKDHGVTGYDAVAFHSGTACKTDPPQAFIREETGTADIHNNNTTGYREIVHMMRSIGIANPVVADTGAGWATMPEANSCNTGASTGKKPGGVDEATQSLFLRDQLGCAEQDPELKYIFIFSLYDVSNAAIWDQRMGLMKTDRTPKRAFSELQSVLKGVKPAFSKGGFCGGYVDHKPPAAQITTSSPVVGGVPIFSGPLQMTAKGTDEHPIKAVRIEVDGKNIPGTTKDGVLDFPSWQGAKDLKLGEHTITATVEDEAGNVAKATPLKIKKVNPNQMPLTATTLTAKVLRVKGRKVTIKGKLTWPKGLVKPSGRIRIWFKKGKFVSKYGVTPSKPFTKTVKLRKPGKWKVTVFYDNKPPFKKATVKPFSVKVR
jgi:hypothetical protein